MISEDQVLKLFFICKANISEFSRKKLTLKSKSAICEIFEQKLNAIFLVFFKHCVIVVRIQQQICNIYEGMRDK